MAAEPSSVPALIAAGASLAVAIVSWLASRSNQQRLIDNQADLQRYQKDLKRLQDELDEKRAERDARRDYEYEALKRLYQECSPLLFQVSEQAASTLGRIRGIAETAAQGNLDAGRDSWLTGEIDRYYRVSTEYRLLAPLATLKLLQRRLTRLDLSLDPEIQLVYTLARQAGKVLSDDFELARASAPALPYAPHLAGVDPTRQPAVHQHQGIPAGILDNAVEALLVRDGDETRRVMSFLEFEAMRKDQTGAGGAALKRIEYLLRDFHPRDRPVLWRILLATACLCRAIGLVAEREPAGPRMPEAAQLILMPDQEFASFDWRADRSDDAGAKAMQAATAAVKAYLLRELEAPVTRASVAIARRSMAGASGSGTPSPHRSRTT